MKTFRLLTLALAVALAAGCVSASKGRVTVADEKGAVDVIFDDKGAPASIYWEGAQNAAAPWGEDDWKVTTGITPDNRPALRISRKAKNP